MKTLTLKQSNALITSAISKVDVELNRSEKLQVSIEAKAILAARLIVEHGAITGNYDHAANLCNKLQRNPRVEKAVKAWFEMRIPHQLAGKSGSYKLSGKIRPTHTPAEIAALDAAKAAAKEASKAASEKTRNVNKEKLASYDALKLQLDKANAEIINLKKALAIANANAKTKPALKKAALKKAAA